MFITKISINLNFTRGKATRQPQTPCIGSQPLAIEILRILEINSNHFILFYSLRWALALLPSSYIVIPVSARMGVELEPVEQPPPPKSAIQTTPQAPVAGPDFTARQDLHGSVRSPQYETSTSAQVMRQWRASSPAPLTMTCATRRRTSGSRTCW